MEAMVWIACRKCRARAVLRPERICSKCRRSPIRSTTLFQRSLFLIELNLLNKWKSELEILNSATNREGARYRYPPSFMLLAKSLWKHTFLPLRSIVKILQDNLSCYISEIPHYSTLAKRIRKLGRGKASIFTNSAIVIGKNGESVFQYDDPLIGLLKSDKTYLCLEFETFRKGERFTLQY